MKLKPPLISAMFLLGGRVCIAQASIAPDVVASAGTCYVNSTTSLSWTIGEVLIETGSSPSNYLTQGFQQPVTVVVSDVTNPNSPNGNVSAYPNPFTSIVYLQNNNVGKILQVELVSVEGKTIFTKTMTAQQEQFDLNEFSNGIYFLRVYNENKQLVQTLKIDKVK
ncbi:MAG TPA: T9SS type A sorting domain-containing protein [Bacteroidia bacterium]|nr:T9SS type A sorting domain-containing protein [Bacteroidia bacterium]